MSVQNPNARPRDFSFLFVGDLHLADTPPGYRTDTYRQDVLDKLAWCMELANKQVVDMVILAGDIFHSRSSVASKLIADTHDVLSLAVARKTIVPGNHDLRAGNRIDSVGEQPLGLLGRMPGVHLSTDLHTGRLLEGPAVVEFVPYEHNMAYESCVFTAPPYLDGKTRILAVHYGITPRKMPYHTLVTDYAAWNPYANLVLAGHIHDDLGAWRDRHGTYIVCPGALSRGSLTEHNLARTPRVIYGRFGRKNEMRSFPVPCRPASECFRLTDKAEEVEAERVASEFLAELGQTQLAAISMEDVIQRIHTMPDLPPRVAELAIAAINEATGLDINVDAPLPATARR